MRYVSDDEIRSRLTEMVAARGLRSTAKALGVSPQFVSAVQQGKSAVGKAIPAAMGLTPGHGEPVAAEVTP